MRAYLLLVVALLLPGCADWPRLGAVEAPEKLPSPGLDPRDLLEVDWLEDVESIDDNDQPTTVTPVPLDALEGRVITGTLQGIGWADALQPTPLSDNNCPADPTGSRSPFTDGDYIADVDFAVFDIPARGTLCVALQVEADSVGWDLVPQPLSPCRVPLGPLTDTEGVPIGVNLGGAGDEWAVVVEAGLLAIGLGGYFPNDTSQDVPYRLSVALLPETSAGDPGLCPNPPETL